MNHDAVNPRGWKRGSHKKLSASAYSRTDLLTRRLEPAKQRRSSFEGVESARPKTHSSRARIAQGVSIGCLTGSFTSGGVQSSLHWLPNGTVLPFQVHQKFLPVLPRLTSAEPMIRRWHLLLESVHRYIGAPSDTGQHWAALNLSKGRPKRTASNLP